MSMLGNLLKTNATTAIAPAVATPIYPAHSEQDDPVKTGQNTVDAIQKQVDDFHARRAPIETKASADREKWLEAQAAKADELAAWANDPSKPDPAGTGLGAVVVATELTFRESDAKLAALDAAFASTGLTAKLADAKTALQQAKRTALENRLKSVTAKALADILDALTRCTDTVAREKLNGDNYSGHKHVNESWAWAQIHEHRLLEGIRDRCTERSIGARTAT